ADDVIGPAVEHDRAADDRPVGREAPLPEALRQHHAIPGRARVILARLEQPSRNRPQTERPEEADADVRAAYSLRLIHAGEGVARVVQRAELVEGAIEIAEIPEIGFGQGDLIDRPRR